MRSAVRRAQVSLGSRRLAPHSRLFLVGDRVDWSVQDDTRRLGDVARRLGIGLGPPSWGPHVRGQSVFYASQFVLLGGDWRAPDSRLGVAYLHGRPGTPGYPEFDRCFENLRAHAGDVARVQVTHAELEELAREAGVERVDRIPIGVDAGAFQPPSPLERATARELFGIPDSAFAVGSLVKDGVGFREGLEPKAIKGPDTLLRALELGRTPELFVVLTAPARGYVKAGLERLGIPYKHVVLERPFELPAVYNALDAVLVASRQEGGPKSVLEGMAAGVPVVSTRVGQAQELIEDGVSGWLADVEDAEALAAGLARVGELDLAAARRVAEANSYEAQLPLWERFWRGFVDW